MPDRDDDASILNPPLAYRNREFLDSEQARPIRILAEYLQPLEVFEQEKVSDTIVFFGSARLTEDGGEFREETVKFFSDPHVFSESCAVLCSELYEFLCLEGFLDLPVDWRVSLQANE